MGLRTGKYSRFKENRQAKGHLNFRVKSWNSKHAMLPMYLACLSHLLNVSWLTGSQRMGVLIQDFVGQTDPHFIPKLPTQR